MSAQQQWAALGRKPKRPMEQDSGPQCPDELVYLWRWFTELVPGLPVSGMAPSVVSWDVLLAWCSLTATDLEPWEAEALVRLGEARCAVECEAAQKESNKK